MAHPWTVNEGESEWDARDKAAQTMQRLVDQTMRQRIARTREQREKLCWTIRYHEHCIREEKEKIAWHRKKVSERQKPQA